MAEYGFMDAGDGACRVTCGSGQGNMVTDTSCGQTGHAEVRGRTTVCSGTSVDVPGPRVDTRRNVWTVWVRG